MESTSQTQTEKSFRYFVRVPSSDGFDVMNVDVKIDTCWIFQDAEDGSGEQGHLPEEVAGSPDVDTAGLRKQLESSEQQPSAAVGQCIPLESELRSRIRELELAERELLRRVHALSARVVKEHNAALRAREQLQALRAELASRVQEEFTARRQREQLRRWRERLRRKDEALGLQAEALERCRRNQRHQLGLARCQERSLRAQVQRLERDVRHLCRAAGLLLAQLGAPEASAEHALQSGAQRGEQEGKDELRCRMSRLRLQEELTQPNRGLATLDRMQGHCALPSWQQDPGRGRDQQEEALGPGASAGPPCTGSCPGGGQGPRVMAPALESTSKFPGDGAGPGCEQVSLVERSPDGQMLLLVLHPPGQFAEGLLLPMDLAQISESLQAAQEHCVPRQASTLPLWGPARDAESLRRLLLQEVPAEGLQAQEEPGARPTAHPCGDCHPAKGHHASLCHELSRTYNHLSLRRGPRALPEAWNEGAGIPVGTAEDGVVRGTSEHSGNVAQAPEGGWCDTGAPESLATACCLWSRQAHPVPLLQGAALEGPQSLSRITRLEGSGWGFPEGLSSEEEVLSLATGSRAQGTRASQLGDSQLTTGKGRAPQRMLQNQEDRRLHFGSALPLQEERAQMGPEEEEMVLPGDVCRLGHSRVPGQPGPQALAGQEMLFCAREHSETQPPGLAVPATRCEAAGSPWGKGRDRCALLIDEFEREVEACFQQLYALHLGTSPSDLLVQGVQLRRRTPALWGENWSFASQWYSGGAVESELKAGSEGVTLRETMAPCTSRAVPGTVPGCNTASPGPAEPWWALERARDSFHQLLSALKKERRSASSDSATPPGHQDRCCRKVCDLEKARAGDAAELRRLEQVNRDLVAALEHLRGELGPCLQAVSDLEACNRESYGKIMQLEEENEKLKGDRGKPQEAVSERKMKSQGVTGCVPLENRELKALMLRLGARYRELIRDAELAVGDMLRALKRENEHLLRSVRGLEREVGLRTSSDMGLLLCGEQHPQGKSTRTADKVHTADKEVQVPGASGHLILRVGGPLSEEGVGVHGGQTGPSLDSQDSRCGAHSPTQAPLGSKAEGPGTLQRSTAGAAGKEAQLEKEEERLWCSFAQGWAPRSPCNGPQDPEAEVAEEDPQLCVRRLCHQVQTLQCQLRDQSWANRELRAVRDQAVHIQSELRAKLEELRKELREARLTLSPLKAKLASLVRKCLMRNRLITRLLQELHRHSLASPPLSELARGMVQDVALVEYAATFLTPGVAEASPLDAGFQDAAAGGAREYLPDSRMDLVLQSPWRPGSWPVPEAEWPAQTAQPASLKV